MDQLPLLCGLFIDSEKMIFDLTLDEAAADQKDVPQIDLTLDDAVDIPQIDLTIDEMEDERLPEKAEKMEKKRKRDDEEDAPKQPKRHKVDMTIRLRFYSQGPVDKRLRQFAVDLPRDFWTYDDMYEPFLGQNHDAKSTLVSGEPESDAYLRVTEWPLNKLFFGYTQVAADKKQQQQLPRGLHYIVIKQQNNDKWNYIQEVYKVLNECGLLNVEHTWKNRVNNTTLVCGVSYTLPYDTVQISMLDLDDLSKRYSADVVRQAATDLEKRLEALHKLGWVHGDIQRQCILVVETRSALRLFLIRCAYAMQTRDVQRQRQDIERLRSCVRDPDNIWIFRHWNHVDMPLDFKCMKRDEMGQLIQHGSNATVYHHLPAGVVKVVPLLDKSEMKVFDQEWHAMKIAAAVHLGPQVQTKWTCPVLDETQRNVGFFVMDIVTGQSVTALKRAGQLPSVDDRKRYFLDLAQKLVAYHQKNVLHQDLHTSNVLIDVAKKQAMVIDFGRAGFPPPPKKEKGEEASVGQSGMFSIAVYRRMSAICDQPWFKSDSVFDGLRRILTKDPNSRKKGRNADLLALADVFDLRSDSDDESSSSSDAEKFKKLRKTSSASANPFSHRRGKRLARYLTTCLERRQFCQIQSDQWSILFNPSTDCIQAWIASTSAASNLQTTFQLLTKLSNQTGLTRPPMLTLWRLTAPSQFLASLGVGSLFSS